MTTFYRLCRVWHGYLSAAAFVWLLFFSITGILLNHPSWLRHDKPSTERAQFLLRPEELVSIKANKEPGRALVQFLRGRLGLRGEISSSDVMGHQLFVRMRGASGASDLDLDLHSGKGTASIESFPVAKLFMELHRGEQAGAVWRALIDIAGIALVLTSTMGLMIYFSLRFRLRTALILVAGGLTAMAGAIVLFVN